MQYTGRTKRVGMSIMDFQGATSNLRSEGRVEHIAIFWGWNEEGITGKGNCMCKHVEERACVSVGAEVAWYC